MSNVATLLSNLAPLEAHEPLLRGSRVRRAISDTPVKVLVIYAPPYGESPDKVIKARNV